MKTYSLKCQVNPFLYIFLDFFEVFKHQSLLLQVFLVHAPPHGKLYIRDQKTKQTKTKKQTTSHVYYLKVIILHVALLSIFNIRQDIVVEFNT